MAESFLDHLPERFRDPCRQRDEAGQFWAIWRCWGALTPYGRHPLARDIPVYRRAAVAAFEAAGWRGPDVRRALAGIRRIGVRDGRADSFEENARETAARFAWLHGTHDPTHVVPFRRPDPTAVPS